MSRYAAALGAVFSTFLLVQLACRTPSQTGTGQLDESECQQDDTAAPVDSEAWKEYVEAVQRRFERTGRCPGPPRRAVMMSGEVYEPDVRVVEAGDEGVFTEGWAFSTPYSVDAKVEVRESQKDYECGVLLDPELSRTPPNGRVGLGARIHSFEGGVEPPLFYSPVVGGTSSDAAAAYLDVWAQLGVGTESDDEYLSSWTSFFGEFAETTVGTYSSTDAYSWICIESVTPDDTHSYDTEPGTWRGGIFLHTEGWVEPGGTVEDAVPVDGAPMDIYVQLGRMDCMYHEDAGWLATERYCVNWDLDCDGLDNDFDGVIDEGQSDDFYTMGDLDEDDNGVPDCMDDWDGDGIPNTDDDDIYECCCDYNY